MLKKFLAGLLTAALCVGVFGTAWAQSYQGAHMVTERVMFRSQRNDATLGLTAQQIANGYIDSVNFTRQGKGVIAGGATGTADTTAPIVMQGAVPNPTGAVATVVDTVVSFRFSLIPGADCAATTTIDSLYVIPQVSVDGSVWECAQLIKDVATACAPFTAASTLTQTIPVLRLTNGGLASILFKAGLSGRVTADVNNLGTWPYIRFIVLNDISASATAAKHQFSAAITYWTNKSSGTN